MGLGLGVYRGFSYPSTRYCKAAYVKQWHGPHTFVPVEVFEAERSGLFAVVRVCLRCCWCVRHVVVCVTACRFSSTIDMNDMNTLPS